MTNAFNNVSREMQAAIRRHCPKASAWAESCYATPSYLFFANPRFSSSSSAQQGDPLSSLFFALYSYFSSSRIMPNLLNAAFLNDVILAGNRADLQG